MAAQTPESETRNSIVQRIRDDLRTDIRNLTAAGETRVGWSANPTTTDGVQDLYPIRPAPGGRLTHYIHWFRNTRSREAKLMNWITMTAIDQPQLNHVMYQAETVSPHLFFQIHYHHNDYNLRVNVSFSPAMVSQYRTVAGRIKVADLLKMASAVYKELRNRDDTPYRTTENAHSTVQYKESRRMESGAYYLRLDLHTSGDYETAHPHGHPIRTMPRAMWGIVMEYMGGITKTGR